jgi:murein L,D-transpeptidase YcbB/YkuD
VLLSLVKSMFPICRHNFPGLQICLVIILQIIVAATSPVAAQTNTQLDRIVTAIQQQVDMQNLSTSVPDMDWEHLREFYVANDYYPVWVDIKGPLPKALVLRDTLQNAAAEGLDPQTYRVDMLTNIWPSRLPEKMAQLDLLLTDALLAYSVDVSYGRLDPQETDPLWHIARPRLDAMAMLHAIIANENIRAALQALPPSQPGYKRLRGALARYQVMQENGGWPPLAAGPLLEFGAYHREVTFLRHRLRIEGDLELRPVRDEEFFDRAVEHAVERFQVRYGLKMDGIVGPATRAAMNVPVTEQIEKIKLNMERWRWLPRQLGQRYIMVNTAGFELAAFENQQPQFTMWVIIGTQERQTPVLSGMMHTVVFNPYWTVPATIAAEELVPKQRRNPKFLTKRGIRVYRNGTELDPRKLDWSKVDKDHLPYIFRQDPGPRNPLGRIKFLFSNQYQIYLHDTPRQTLFNHTTRAFSHGCVRVEDPLRLATFVLGGNSDWDQDKIKALLAADDSIEMSVAVKEPVPIYLVYWTAWVAEDGGVFFRPDIYERDQPDCSEAAAKTLKTDGSADIIH